MRIERFVSWLRPKFGLLFENKIPHSLHITIFGKNELPNIPEGNLHLVEEMLSFCQKFQQLKLQ